MVALFGACTFTPGEPMGPGGTPTPSPTPGTDAPMVAQRPPCDLTDPSVRLCLDFESTPLGLDSSTGQHDASVSHASGTPRAPEQAVAVDMSSTIVVDETGALDIPDHITLETWIDPAHPPAFGAYLALSNPGQYDISVQPDGKVRCSLAGIHADSKDPISFATWTHVACTYDQQKMILFVNGSSSACVNGTARIATDGFAGTGIGMPFVGAIDNVHILARTAQPSEICTHAGQSQCESSCDGG